MFVCLFVWGFSSHSRIFHSYGDANMTGEGLEILTYVYARDSWPLSSEGYLACHTYCDTGHSPIAESLAVELSFVLSRLGFEHSTFRLSSERSNPLCHRCGWFVMKPKLMDRWLIELYIVLHQVPFKNISLKYGRQYSPWRATKFRSTLGGYNIWAERDL